MCRTILISLFILILSPAKIIGNNNHFQEDSIRAARLYRSGINLNRNRMYSEALDSFLVAHNIRKKIYGDESSLLANTSNAIAIVYKNLGLYDLAIQYSLMAEKAFVKKYGTNYRSIAGVYQNLGNIYRLKLNFNDALRYYNQVARIYSNQESVNEQEVAGSYYSIAEIYYRIFNYNEALTIINKQLDKSDDEIKVLYYDLLGAIYQELKDDKQASKYYKKAIDLSIQLYSEDDNAVAIIYLNFASFLVKINESDKAIEILTKANKIISLTQQERGEYLSEYYRVYGSLLESKPIESKDINTFKQQKFNNLEESVLWYKKALTALNFPAEIAQDNNWDTIFLISEIRCLDILKLIGDKYIQMSQIVETDDKNKYAQAVKSAIEYYQVTGDLLQWAKKEISGDESKIELAELEQSTFVKTVQACYKAYELTGDVNYLELAFKNAEQLKSGSIFDKLSDQLARENSLIPDSLIQKEQLINSRITTYSEILFNEKKSETPDNVLIAQTDSLIFQLKRQRTELNDYLVKNYKDYYNLKYSDALAGISEIQRRMKKNEALIEYVLNENDSIPELYTFFITSNHKKFVKQRINQGFIHQIQSVFHFMSNSKYMFTKNEDSKAFCIASNELYKTLIEPFRLEINSKKLIIVPDGKLSYIPFDALLEQLPDTTETINFSQLSYLLKKNCVNYSYSANLLYGLDNKKRKTNRTVLAFAPEYITETIDFENQQVHLTPLPGIQREVELISGEIKTELFRGNDATETNFRENAEKYGILHLAMHAFINDSLPAFSRLAFSQSKENQTESDGWLNTADIYNLNLNASLTVLSACNTGSGVLRKGEGVMSLARGFFYAGCPSIVMTLWEVEDNSGTKIMSTFYQHLKKGRTKDEALRLAKLDYLENANSRLAHPHYWLGYVSIGENSSLFRSYDFYFFSLIFLAIAGITAEQIVRLKRARKKQDENQ